MKVLLASIWVVLLPAVVLAVQTPNVQYCSCEINTHVTVPRGTLQVAVNCWQAEYKKEGQKGKWQATGHRSESTTGVYRGPIPGEAIVSLCGYTGENGHWGACDNVRWTVSFPE